MKNWKKKLLLFSLAVCMLSSLEARTIPAKAANGSQDEGPGERLTEREDAGKASDASSAGTASSASSAGTASASDGGAAETSAAGGSSGQAASDGSAAGDGNPGSAGNAGSDGTGSDAVSQAASSGEAGAAAEENPNLVFSNGRYVDISKPMVALTYDDGPRAANGNRIMDLLEQYNGRATFFLVGNMVAANKAEVQRMVADGMEVANHSWDHQYFNKLGAAAIQSEVAKCNNAIYEACGVMPSLLRLPGGNITNTVRANVTMPMIYWTIDTRDWEHRNAAKTVDHVLGKVKDGDIVLMHEIWESTVTAQATIIPALYAQGFQMVTVSELAAFRGYALGTGVQYVSFPMKLS